MQHISRVARATCAVTLVVALASACSGGSGSTAGPTTAPTTTVPVPTPTLTTTIDDGAQDVGVSNPIGLTITDGTLESVELSVRDDAGQATPLGAGLFNQARTGWLSPGLAPHTGYELRAAFADQAGAVTERTWAFATGAPERELHTTLNVGDAGVYGVGMPLVVTLNEPVDESRRAALTERLNVSSTPAVEGAWRWTSDTEIRFRPKEYWPAHTQVSLDIDFTGFDAGNGVWGVDGRTVNFEIGDAHVAVVDAAAHRMVVRSNGEVVREMLVSTGKDSTPTRSGIHVVNEKAETVIMDSATVGIPQGSPGYYRLTTQWNVRISNSGEFVHSAPWSVGSQGYANVSHGCVNVNPTDAEWYYHFTRNGDVVEVINTNEAHQVWNGYGDWQMPWDQWLAESTAV